MACIALQTGPTLPKSANTGTDCWDGQLKCPPGSMDRFQLSSMLCHVQSATAPIALRTSSVLVARSRYLFCFALIQQPKPLQQTRILNCYPSYVSDTQ